MILETERLYLRELKQEDLDRLHAIFSDEETMRFYPAPFTREQTGQWIQKNQERYRKDGFGLWGVCLKETDELIGDCGLVRQTVDGRTEIEIGYHIHKKYWSRGFATEAAKACKAYGFHQLHFNKLICLIDPKNIPSIRVAEKIGFTKEKEVFIFGKNHAVYSGDKE
ncbi:GNAT family N-acetyltransferase [Thermoactinomyces intermedius]|uniref:GNAT family N-acetyltransferase n=2 Tax=Thermoactinomyces TaxID=2023 RepID=A0A8I1A6W3_THEIN|nr:MULTISPECIES: GNAT family N-acetyltransferase [Thermoactinomyces]MBA4547899.1 GNAT family N-acetyltransferase [Thermoactinomyces intermedius]MBA4550777.1 GNAT family N-acetyltransferase [Thermoactinomyces vulgaris]MBA4596164.1 GNAT family N-acetyltransferase [Thermoactinomyces vulgaris]MBA4836490.1 GNAT family N-acetyltransferase [Thermoactinomyces intermedius]MBH8588553.1 GNAT family N-acetyltransferase [Thermoactinomyces vulgaris]